MEKNDAQKMEVNYKKTGSMCFEDFISHAKRGLEKIQAVSPDREKAMAITKLDEALLWLKKGRE